MSSEDDVMGRPARPLDRRERSELAEIADQIDRESPSLAAGLRGPQRASTRLGRQRRGGVQASLLVLVLLLVAASMVTSVSVWGLAGLAASSATLVAVLAVMTFSAACT